MKKYIFNYDQKERSWNGRIHALMLTHSGMECFVDEDDIEEADKFDLVGISFEDGTILSAFTYELEEVCESVKE